MPQHLDHYQLSTRNIYMSAQKLREDTGLGFYDGGYFAGGGIANKIFPLGGSAYLEVEGVVDAGMVATSPGAKRFYDRTADGECFSLICMRVDTMDELHAIATRLNTTVSPKPASRVRPDGPLGYSYNTPQGAQRDPAKIAWYCHEDRMNVHPSGQPVFNWPGMVRPLGIAFLEMGGTEQEMTDWIGEPASNFPYKFFPDRPKGLYCIGVNTNKGVVEIRRPWRV